MSDLLDFLIDDCVNIHYNEGGCEDKILSKHLSISISNLLKKERKKNLLKEGTKNLKYFQLIDTNTKQFLEMQKLDGWTLGTKEKDVTSYFKNIDNAGVSCVKVHGLVKCPAEFIFEHVTNLDRMNEWVNFLN